ncbi:hypothetical protein ES1_08820 [[Eubacterium] siraeum V10Sc8a]|jgi:hypothetical protein|uniref:Uncharacterized protein n=1 Tax=[Eubacterium] siraeum V10Sc8a TaxID=717961 RepID=D4MJM2_9FIRM|nr:hypothetical protein ES1_08820 [[Eubacterium] siraeum V10Sc8a]
MLSYFLIRLYNCGIDFNTGGVYNKLVSAYSGYNTEV